MLTGTVMNEVCLRAALPGAQGLRWLRVCTENGNEALALDRVNARTGDRVLLCGGDGAWRSCQVCPVDMVAVGVLDGNNG